MREYIAWVWSRTERRFQVFLIVSANMFVVTGPLGPRLPRGLMITTRGDAHDVELPAVLGEWAADDKGDVHAGARVDALKERCYPFWEGVDRSRTRVRK